LSFFKEYFPLHAQSLTQIKKKIACSKHSNLESEQFFIFSNVFIFYQMCTIPFEIGEEFNINYWKEKRVELIKFFL
jgi:hypothetical protein